MGPGHRRDAAMLDAHVHLWDLTRHPHDWIDPATMPALARDLDVADVADDLVDNRQNR